MTDKQFSDGVFSRMGAFADTTIDDPIGPELRAVLNEFGNSQIMLSQAMKVAMEMEEYGLDPTTAAGRKKAAEVLRRRLTSRTEWFDSKLDSVRREAAIERADGNECIYYIDLYGACVKIGYTAHLLNRVQQLRRSRKHLLAVEPGGRAMERLRHREFAHERIEGREDFQRSDRLLTHIDALVKQHGQPLDYLAKLGGAA